MKNENFTLADFIEAGAQALAAHKAEIKIERSKIIDPKIGEAPVNITIWTKNKELKGSFQEGAAQSILLQIVMKYGNFFATIAQAQTEKTETPVIKMN